jgi:hypothetical protein
MVGGEYEPTTRRSGSPARTHFEDGELTRFVVDQLSRSRGENDVILAVCQRFGLAWPEAQRRVRGLRATHPPQIAAGQRPVLLFLAIVTAIGGAAGIWQGATYLFGVWAKAGPLDLAADYGLKLAIGGLLGGPILLAAGVFGLLAALGLVRQQALGADRDR